MIITRALLVAFGTATALLGGCASLEPQPLTPAEIAAANEADRAALRKDVEPLRGALTLEAAIARAIKYNAEHRVRMMEQAVASGMLDVSRFDLLPEVVASAGYRARDNDLLTLNQDLSTGQVIGGRTISSSRSAVNASLGLSWSLLDFGQSYYNARQNADRVLVAGERRRKAVHTLIQDVRTSFWRTASAQALRETVRGTILEAERALDDARRTEQEGLRSPVEPLRYQRELLDNLRLLEAIEQELSTARVELASLTNIPLTQDFAVVEPDPGLGERWLEIPIEELEAYALMLNADLREDMYNARIAQVETRLVLLELFPGISFNASTNYDDDSFLINDTWNQVGIQISMNLLNLLSAPARMQLADAGVALADQRRMSTQLAVLTQLHIARRLYANALRQFTRAEELATVDGRLAEHVSNQARAAKVSKLVDVDQRTVAILSELRRYRALAHAQAAASRLQATLGLQPDLSGAQGLDVAALGQVVQASLRRWSAGELPALPVAAGATPK